MQHKVNEKEYVRQGDAKKKGRDGEREPANVGLAKLVAVPGPKF